MNLIINDKLFHRLHTKQKIALSAFPFGLMFGSFALIWPFSSWLARVLDIPRGAPVKDQPNGLLFMGIFLTVMVFLMVGGFLVGWWVNWLAMRIVLKWPEEKVRRALER